MLHSFLLICHPYPPSFHEMIFLLVEASLERQGAPKMLIRIYVHTLRSTRTRTHAHSQTAPLLSRRFASFRVGALYLGVFDWKVQRFCCPKGTSLECVESIYVKITETACVSDELRRFKEDGQIVSLYRRFACTGTYSYLKHANS